MKHSLRKPRRPSHDRWLLSYADFLTLLFAVFVVLYASSLASRKKQSDLAHAMQDAFAQMGSLGGAPHASVATDEPPEAMEAAAHGALLREQRLRRAMARAVEKNRMPSGSILLHTTAEGLVISLREAGFFASGAAEIKSGALPVLVELARNLPEGAVRVEGHTDDMPIHTAQFPSNWELSGGRAATIARILLEQGHVEPARMAAMGLAEFHPLAPNTTEAGRAQNRRVDVIVLR